MVKHIILWKLKDGLSPAREAEIKAGIKSELERLPGIIPGLLELHVQTEGLESSSADLMLDSTFDDADALKNYAVHPAHVEVADTRVRPYVQTRLCMDYDI